MTNDTFRLQCVHRSGFWGPKHCLKFRLPWIGHACPDRAGLGSPVTFFPAHQVCILWCKLAFLESAKLYIMHHHAFLCFFVTKKMFREGRRGVIRTQLADVGLTGLKFWKPHSCFKRQMKNIEQLGLLGFSASKCIRIKMQWHSTPATCNFSHFQIAQATSIVIFVPAFLMAPVASRFAATGRPASSRMTCHLSPNLEMKDHIVIVPSYEQWHIKSYDSRENNFGKTFLRTNITLLLWPLFPNLSILSNLKTSEGIALGLASTFVVPNSGNSKATTRTLRGPGIPRMVVMVVVVAAAAFSSPHNLSSHVFWGLYCRYTLSML